MVNVREFRSVCLFDDGVPGHRLSELEGGDVDGLASGEQGEEASTISKVVSQDPQLVFVVFLLTHTRSLVQTQVTRRAVFFLKSKIPGLRCFILRCPWRTKKKCFDDFQNRFQGSELVCVVFLRSNQGPSLVRTQVTRRAVFESRKFLDERINVGFLM